MIVFKKDEGDSAVMATIIIAVLFYIAFHNFIYFILVLIISFLVYSRTKNNGIYIDQKAIIIKEGFFRLNERKFQTNNILEVRIYSELFSTHYLRRVVFVFIVDKKEQEYGVLTNNSYEISLLQEYLQENGIRYEEI